MKIWISVPSRGAIFLNAVHGITLTRTGFMFPSPLGELYFLINVDRLYEVFTGVSVPSRGAIFLNNSELDVWKAVMLVSVPSRGAIFLNLQVALCTSFREQLMPSALGELYFLIYFLPCQW